MKIVALSIATLLLAGNAFADGCTAAPLHSTPAKILWRTPAVIRAEVDGDAVFVETRRNLRRVDAKSGATIWTYSFATEEDVPPQFVVLPRRVAIIRDEKFISFLARDTGEELARRDVGEWVRILAGPPLTVVTQATDAKVSTLIRLDSDGTIVSHRTVPLVNDLTIVDGVAAAESEQGIVDPDLDAMTGYDLDTLQTLWSEKSFTFNKQVIGNRLYLSDIFWSDGAKVLDPKTGVIERMIPKRDPFQIGGSEKFDLQVVTTKWEGAWSPHFATCEGLRRNDATTGRTKWQVDLPFRVSGTLREGRVLYVAGSRDTNNRLIAALDWNSGKVEQAWSGVPEMSELHRTGNEIIGFDLAGELVAISLLDR